ncbi:MAG: lysoplasmalogenase family protein [Tsuneonella suprasediminis]
MPRRTLIEDHPWLLASLAASIAFYFLPEPWIGSVYAMMLKGLSVGFLVPYALVRHHSLDARLLAIIMAFGAAGDVGMELDTIVGGAIFFIGHLIAIGLYWRNRRTNVTGAQRAAALTMLVMVPIISWLLSGDAGVGIYAIGLGAMAASAWLSRFGRYHVGAGAILFIVSDWLIFARMGGALPESVTSWLIWPLYYAGQFMICTGIIQGLRRDHRA